MNSGRSEQHGQVRDLAVEATAAQLPMSPNLAAKTINLLLGVWASRGLHVDLGAQRQLGRLPEEGNTPDTLRALLQALLRQRDRGKP